MLDNDHKTPIPKVMDVATFHQRFGSDEACLEHLRRLRWGANLERFECPECGRHKMFSVSARLFSGFSLTASSRRFTGRFGHPRFPCRRL